MSTTPESGHQSHPPPCLLRVKRHIPVPLAHFRFSNRPSRSSTFRLTATAMSTPLTGSCFSSESAQGPSIMGFEDERDNLYRGLVVSSNGRSKRTCELISSIGPRGTSFHC